MCHDSQWTVNIQCNGFVLLFKYMVAALQAMAEVANNIVADVKRNNGVKLT
jgi:hypothetical protein